MHSRAARDDAATSPTTPPATVSRAALPAPTQDLQQGLANLREYGVTIYPDALTGELLARTREALFREIEWDRNARRHVPHPFDAQGSTNVRVWNLISKDPLFEAMATHPVVMAYLRAVIGWPARISTLSGNVNYPGSKACVLHADQIWAPEPWAAVPQGINFGWCLDDFTPEKGSTRVVPRSHLLNRLPRQDDLPGLEFVQVEAPAGSLLIFESRLWHQTGDFTASDGVRAAIFGFYQKPIYTPAENWYLQTRPEVLLRASDELRTLMGYAMDSLGMAN
jgi:ectoine hydroxylase-related dioxygenase (phytanoyl-CoA dioxygenase family)